MGVDRPRRMAVLNGHHSNGHAGFEPPQLFEFFAAFERSGRQRGAV